MFIEIAFGAVVAFGLYFARRERWGHVNTAAIAILSFILFCIFVRAGML